MSKETIHIRKAGGSIETWCGLTLTEKPPNCIKWGNPYEGDCEACIEAFSESLVEGGSRMTTMRVVYPNDGWVSGVSDGLSLACSRCGEHPRFDWNIDDYVWNEVMRAYPDEWRFGVVCLPCFEVLADEQDVEEWEWRVREIQFTGKRATTVFTAAFCFAHGYRADGHGGLPDRRGGAVSANEIDAETRERLIDARYEKVPVREAYNRLGKFLARIPERESWKWSVYMPLAIRFRGEDE